MVRWYKNWSVYSRLMLLILLLNLLDFSTTATLVWEYGYSAEFNPILRSIMEYFDSVWALLWFKLIIVGIIWVAVLQYLRWSKAKPYIMKRALILVNIGFAVICLWNLGVIYML